MKEENGDGEGEMEENGVREGQIDLLFNFLSYTHFFPQIQSPKEEKAIIIVREENKDQEGGIHLLCLISFSLLCFVFIFCLKFNHQKEKPIIVISEH